MLFLKEKNEHFLNKLLIELQICGPLQLKDLRKRVED